MTEPTSHMEKLLAFYRTLTDAVYQGRQSLARVEQVVVRMARRRTVSPSELASLANYAIQTMRQSPYRGYILATLAYRMAGANEDMGAWCALALAKTGNCMGEWSRSIDLCLMARAVFAQRGELLAATRCELQLATAQHRLGHNAKALMQCEAALASFKRHQVLEEAAEAALLLASIYRTQGRYCEADQEVGQAHASFLAEGLTINVARCEVELAYIRACEQRYDEAMELLSSADTTFTRAGATVEAAWGYRIQALVHIDCGKYHDALKVLHEVSTMYAAEQMRADLRNCDRNIANVYRRLGRSDEALALYIRLRREFAAQGMQIDVANCDMNIALTYKDQNRYAEALPFFQQAIDVCLATGMRLHAARCQTNMALAEEMLGTYDRALERHQQARDVFVTSGLSVNVAHCDENMARIHIIIHQYDRALELLLQAQRGFQSAKSTVLLAANQMLLAQVYQASGQYDQAYEMIEQAHTAYAAERMTGHQGLCLLQLANLERTRGAPDRAAELYMQARREFLDRCWLVNAALCELGLGDVSLAQGQDDAAQSWFASALPILSPDLPDWAWRAHYGLARCHKRADALTQALDHYLATIDAVRRGRSGLHTPQGSSDFFFGRQHLYDEALELAMRMGATDRALEIVEQSKAQVYLALLAAPLEGLCAKPTDDIMDDVLARERAAQGRIEGLQQALSIPIAMNEEAATGNSETAQSDLLNQLTEARREHAELVARLFRVQPLWTSTTHPPPFAVDGLRGAMAGSWVGPWGALIYSLDGERLTILYLDSQSIMGWTRVLSAFDRKLLQTCASSYEARRDTVYQRVSSNNAGTRATGSAFLRQLFRLLIPEAVQERLSPEQLLIIAPRGLFHGLPFHALQAPGGAYLAQQATVVYTPSLHIFQVLLGRGGQRRATKTTALVVGISEFGERAPYLPTTLIEARAAYRLLGGHGRLCLNDEATRPALLAMSEAGHLCDYQIIHFATHIVFDEDAPLQSRVLMHDSDLTVMDIFGLHLDADLVTLSSCEGARSDLNLGDELLGLAQALFHAGARAVIAGLWKVPDETTSVLMTLFYRALRAGQMPVHALRSAQRQMIAEGYTPFHWAPFILLGHPGHAVA